MTSRTLGRGVGLVENGDIGTTVSLTALEEEDTPGRSCSPSTHPYPPTGWIEIRGGDPEFLKSFTETSPLRTMDATSTFPTPPSFGWYMSAIRATHAEPGLPRADR
jgi:hypothetical protein